MVKTNENQSIITMKFNPIFWKKSHHVLLWSQWDPSRHQGLPEWYHRCDIKKYWVKFRKTPGNINYSTFPPGWATKLCNMHQGDGKFSSSFQLQQRSREWFYRPNFHRGTRRGEFRWDTERCVIELFVCAYVVVKGSVTIPNQNKFF